MSQVPRSRLDAALPLTARTPASTKSGLPPFGVCFPRLVASCRLQWGHERRVRSSASWRLLSSFGGLLSFAMGPRKEGALNHPTNTPFRTITASPSGAAGRLLASHGVRTCTFHSRRRACCPLLVAAAIRYVPPTWPPIETWPADVLMDVAAAHRDWLDDRVPLQVFSRLHGGERWRQD